MMRGCCRNNNKGYLFYGRGDKNAIRCNYTFSMLIQYRFDVKSKTGKASLISLSRKHMSCSGLT